MQLSQAQRGGLDRPTRFGGNSSRHSTDTVSIRFNERQLPPSETKARGVSAQLGRLKQKIWTNRCDEKELARIPNTVNEHTLRHEWGHALIAVIAKLPFKGLLITNPGELGAQLQNTDEYPKTQEALFKQILMRVSGLSGEKTLPAPAYFSPEEWEKALLSEASHDLDTLIDIMTYGRQKGWLSDAQCAHFPAFNINRYDALAKKPANAMKPQELLEQDRFLGRFKKITQVPVIHRALAVADRIQQLLDPTTRQAINTALQSQSYFSEKKIKEITEKYISQDLRQRMLKEINRFVQNEMRHV